MSIPHPDDIKAIHVLRLNLGMDDESYALALDTYSVTSSTQLTFEQARAFRSILQQATNSARRASEKALSAYANDRQIKRLRFHALPCAIHYAQDLGAHVLDDGQIIAGEDLRAWLRSQWELGRRRANQGVFEPTIPPELMGRLYSKWINRKCNEWLIEKEYKQRVARMDTFWFNDMLAIWCDHLITRFRAMHEALEKRETSALEPMQPATADDMDDIHDSDAEVEL